jgi:hypothetical protein
LKPTAKFTAIQDILMDPEFQKHRKDGVERSMGYAHPGLATITAHAPKPKKRTKK